MGILAVKCINCLTTNAASGIDDANLMVLK